LFPIENNTFTSKYWNILYALIFLY